MPDTNTHILLWAFPIAVSFHVFEEFAFPGGLIQWIQLRKPRRAKGNMYYVLVNAATIVIGVVIALGASGVICYDLFLNFVALMGGNALSHIRASMKSQKYCPGTVTCVLVLFPLSVVSFWFFVYTGRVDVLSAILNACLGGFVGFYLFSVDARKIDRCSDTDEKTNNNQDMS